MAKASYIENQEQWEKEFVFSYSMPVRFGEIDGFNHVNNTKVFVYLEEARIAFFRNLGLMQSWGMPFSREIPVTADLQCDFLRQILYGDTVTVFVKIHEIGNSSFDLHYLGKNQNDETLFTARGRIVQISRENGRPLPWSEEWKERFSEHEKTV